jgi:integrase
MPKKAKELSATEVRRLNRPGLHAVGGVSGLLLQVIDSGARSWILRTMVGKKRRDIGLGGFPDVSLATAREKARDTKEKIKQGVDPVAERKAVRNKLIAAQGKFITFRDAAIKCHAARAQEFRNAKHARDWLSSLERYAFPIIGDMPLGDVDVPHIKNVLDPIWTTKTETATRVRQRLEAVLSWGTVSKHRTGENPARWEANLKELLPKPSKVIKKSNFRSLPYKQVPAFMTTLRKQDGIGAKALEFAILTVARSGEVRLAEWSEIDLGNKVWTIPAARMKAGKEHKIMLCHDAIKLLEGLPRHDDRNFLFAAKSGGPISDMTISAVCRRMKVDAVPHGFRSSFKEWARNLKTVIPGNTPQDPPQVYMRYDDEVSELALAHVNSDKTRAAYARDGLLEPRTRMMADWFEFLNSKEGIK